MEKPPVITNLEFKYTSYKVSELAELFCTYKYAHDQYLEPHKEAIKLLKNGKELSLHNLKVIEEYRNAYDHVTALGNLIIEKCRNWKIPAKSLNLRFESGAQVIIRPYPENKELQVEMINSRNELLKKSKTPTS